MHNKWQKDKDIKYKEARTNVDVTDLAKNWHIKNEIVLSNLPTIISDSSTECMGKGKDPQLWSHADSYVKPIPPVASLGQIN